jgi:hypothetical protein
MDPVGERSAPPARLRPRSGGVSVIAGGLLQDLEDRLRRDLAPIEERIRPGEETRSLGGGAGGIPGDASDPLVIVLPDRT